MTKKERERLAKQWPKQPPGCQFYADGDKIMFDSHGDGVFFAELRVNGRYDREEVVRDIVDLINAAPDLLKGAG